MKNLAGQLQCLFLLVITVVLVVPKSSTGSTVTIHNNKNVTLALPLINSTDSSLLAGPNSQIQRAALSDNLIWGASATTSGYSQSGVNQSGAFTSILHGASTLNTVISNRDEVATNQFSSRFECNCLQIAPNPDFNGALPSPTGQLNMFFTPTLFTYASGAGREVFNVLPPRSLATVSWELRFADANVFGEIRETRTYDGVGNAIFTHQDLGWGANGLVSIPFQFIPGTGYSLYLYASAGTSSISGSTFFGGMSLSARATLKVSTTDELFSFPEDEDGDPAYKPYFCSDFGNYQGAVQLTRFLPGDFDFDGDVDGRDFLAWQRNPNLGNLADWQENYGLTSELIASSTSIPEPSTLALAISLAAACSLARRNFAL